MKNSTASTIKRAGIGLAAATAMMAWSLAAHAEDTYKIGWASDKSNYLSFVDEPLAKGMEVAIDEINAKGGIGGKMKIELDRRDMKSDPMLGATFVQELIAAGAKFIVTTCDTDVSLPGAQMAAKASLPVMSSCGADAAGPSQVPDGYGFLNVPGSLTQGAFLAEYAAAQGYKKAFTLKSKSEGYTHTLANASRNSAARSSARPSTRSATAPIVSPRPRWSIPMPTSSCPTPSRRTARPSSRTWSGWATPSRCFWSMATTRR